MRVPRLNFPGRSVASAVASGSCGNAGRLSLALLLARLNFRRSGLGPLWGTVGVFFTVGAVGLLFGTILRRQLVSFDDYVNALASGLVMWSFLSAMACDSSIAFARWMPILRHSTISFSVISLSLLLRHLPVLALNTVLLFVLQLALVGLRPAPLPMAAAMVLLIINVSWMGVLTMVLGARFRDIGQMVANVMQIAFLLTPILWPPYFLGRFEYLLTFNPFYYQLSIFTSSAAGAVAPAFHWLAASTMAAGGSMLALVVYRSSRHRWPYWI